VLCIAQLKALSADVSLTACGSASWYGEDHRGLPMANGKPFNPDRLTAASWFYPLGSKLLVTVKTRKVTHKVVVTVTDRGPAKHLVQDGRIIDLTYAAFKHLANPNRGLVEVSVRPIVPHSESSSPQLASVR
jgi:rare lipoprotein A